VPVVDTLSLLTLTAEQQEAHLRSLDDGALAVVLDDAREWFDLNDAEPADAQVIAQQQAAVDLTLRGRAERDRRQAASTDAPGSDVPEV
jgi:hypothetical protein